MINFIKWKKGLTEDVQTQLIDYQQKIKLLKIKLKTTKDENQKDQIEKEIASISDQKNKLLEL